MDVEKCRALLAAIDTGSMAAAAQQLGYTPSGISRALAALEDETGFALLFRGHSGVMPTAECRQLLPGIRELVYRADACRQLAGRIRGVETGSLTIGIAYSAYYVWLADTIARFRSDHPNIDLHIIEGISIELLSAMEERRADIGIMSRLDGCGGWIPLTRDPMAALVPEGHPLAKLDAFPMSAFETEPYIELCPDKETDNARLLAKRGIKPNVRFTTSDSVTVYAMVEAGLGVALINSISTRYWTGRVKVMPLDPPHSVDIGICYPDPGALSPAARRFVSLASRRSPALG